MSKGVKITCLLALFLLFPVFTVNATQQAESNSEGVISQDQELENQEEAVVTDIDLGDYQSTLEVGSSQVLMVTLLPLGSEADIQYHSTDETVATINGMGRVTGIKEGNTMIQVTAGECTKEFQLTVVPQEETEYISVTEIELGNYETQVEVDNTITISVTVLPSDATDAEISYISKMPSIATITSTGEIKGITTGTAEIEIQAGEIKKTIYIDVIVTGKAIQLNTNYIVLKIGETYQLEGTVTPTDASQSITYASLDSGIANVSSSGFVTGKELGSTGIVVTSADVTSFVSVIVNETGTLSEEEKAMIIEEVDSYSKEEETLILLIESLEEIEVMQVDYPVLSKVILKILYQTQKSIIILGEGYEIQIDGKNIANYEQSFYTDIILDKDETGVSFTVNNGKSVMGKISLKLELDETYKYLYLYHETKGIYEKLEYKGEDCFEIDMEGTYVLTNEKLDGFSIKVWHVCFMLIVIVGLTGGYIYVKKKHWFW